MYHGPIPPILSAFVPSRDQSKSVLNSSSFITESPLPVGFERPMEGHPGGIMVEI